MEFGHLQLIGILSRFNYSRKSQLINRILSFQLELIKRLSYEQ